MSCNYTANKQCTNFVVIKVCMKIQGSLMQDKQVILLYCGEFTVKHCFGLVRSGCDHDQI